MKALLTTNGYGTAFDGLSLVDDALRTFDRMWRSPALGRSVRSAWVGAPDFEVDTNDEGWILRADLPGVRPEDLEVEAHGDRLLVRAKRALDAPEGYRPVRRERAELAFERSFEFGRGFDADHVSAELKHGTLRIRVPKRAEEKPRAITVQAE